MASEDEDQALACYLQMLYDAEDEESLSNIIPQASPAKDSKKFSLVDQFWELTDPNPDIHALFLQFDREFFWGRLKMVEVKWSPRMTLCAGVCSYEGRGGLCSIRLSEPLLKLRPRKDLVETLLHEMIHAYLFVTHNNKDHNDHGPEFHKHMFRINKEAGTRITVYHTFHDEVDSYRQHWWRCTGPCQKMRPFFGFVKRAMNRAPSPRDPWWADHAARCPGTFIKVREPKDYNQKSKSGKNSSKGNLKEITNQMSKEGDIRKYLGTSPAAKGSDGLNLKLPKFSLSSSSSFSSSLSFKEKCPTPISPSPSPTSNIHTFGMFQDVMKSTPSPGKVVFTPFSGTGHKLGSKDPKKFSSPSSKPMFKSVASKRSIPACSNRNSNSFSQNTSDRRSSKERRIDQMFSQVPKTPCPKTITLSDVFDSDDESHQQASPPPRTLMVNCPACGSSVKESEINSHLDRCLSP